MLSEIACEVLRFLSRRDLDRACAVSKWLDAMIAQSCGVFPLRPVHTVELHRYFDYFHLNVGIAKFVMDAIPDIHHSFGRVD